MPLTSSDACNSKSNLRVLNDDSLDDADSEVRRCNLAYRIEDNFLADQVGRTRERLQLQHLFLHLQHLN